MDNATTDELSKVETEALRMLESKGWTLGDLSISYNRYLGRERRIKGWAGLVARNLGIPPDVVHRLAEVLKRRGMVTR